jgi:hypothetical protein
LFPGIFPKLVVARFDQRHGSSDGGALLLKAADRRYELIAALASCLRDERPASKIDHTLEELLAQRVFAIACGYPDANDAARLRPSRGARLAGGRAQRRIRGRDGQECGIEAQGQARHATARKLSRHSSQTEHVYAEARYAAQTWPQQRRVILKAEVVRADGKQPKDNPRFVITNLQQSPQWIDEQVYCQRGEIENRIKELHDLQIDRTRCSQFWANQFRVLLTAAAYVLMQELRLRATGTNWARAQVWRLRERRLKLGAQVVASVRRVVVHLPHSFPFLPTFRKVALALGSLSG